jgi:adenosylcobinamide-phosphate synthase
MPALAERVPTPTSAMAALGRWLGRRLDRPQRSERTLFVRGALAALVIVGLAGGVGWLLDRLAQHTQFGAAFEVLVMVTALAQRRVFTEAQAPQRALARTPGTLASARKAAARLLAPGWDANALDAHGVARIAVEATAVGFAERVVGPVFWCICFGLPGMLASTAVTAVAKRTPEESRYAHAMLRLDDALQYVPARIAAFMLAFAALFVPAAHPIAALGTMFREGGKHPTLNRGWPIAAAAGALGLALSGPRRAADGRTVGAAWIGAGRARAERNDVRRALFLHAVACLVDAALVAALFLLKRLA